VVQTGFCAAALPGETHLNRRRVKLIKEGGLGEVKFIESPGLPAATSYPDEKPTEMARWTHRQFQTGDMGLARRTKERGESTLRCILNVRWVGDLLGGPG